MKLLKLSLLIFFLQYHVHSHGTGYKAFEQLSRMLDPNQGSYENKMRQLLEIPRATSPSPLYKTVQKSDIEAYYYEMSRLLSAPLDEFAEAISYWDEKGNSIIHLMIKAKKHREEFSSEMRTLLFLMSGEPLFQLTLGQRFGFGLDSKTEQHPLKNHRLIALGNETILIPPLEETAIGQAILSKNKEKVRQLLHKLILEGPVSDIIRVSYAESKDGRTAGGYIKDLFSLSNEPLLYKNPFMGLRENKDVRRFFLTGDKLTELAASEGNQSAYIALENHIGKGYKKRTPIPKGWWYPLFPLLFAHVIGWSVGQPLTVTENFFPPAHVSQASVGLELVAQALLSMTVVPIASVCHRAFKKSQERQTLEQNILLRKNTL